MAERIINIHAHVFNSKCSAQDFLQTSSPVHIPDWLAIQIKSAIETGDKSWMATLLRLFPNDKSAINKYISLIKIGSESTQLSVFMNLLNQWRQFDSNVAIVGLTMDMDSSTDVAHRPKTPYPSQMWEIMDIKAKYPNNFFPFIGVDPRTRNGADLAEWVNTWVVKNKVFAGVKLYPPLGFFPFDSRLTELYSLCEAEQIPIMSHCTRGGSFNTSKNIEALVRSQITYCFNPQHPQFAFIQGLLNEYAPAKPSLGKRFARWWPNWLGGQTNWTRNEIICNLFSHPNNYEVVLDKFPKLKLCIAHFGGSNEVLGKSSRKVHPKDRNGKWYEIIKKLVNTYEGVHTDVSFTHASIPALEKIRKEIKAGTIKKEKVLFGTDYYVVESEGNESFLASRAMEELNQEPGLFEQMSQRNNKAFLGKYF